MKYHKIRGVPLEDCAVEQKLAYNLAWRLGTESVKKFLYGSYFDEREIPADVPADVLEKAVKHLLDEFSRNPEKKPRYDAAALEYSLTAGLLGYARKNFIAGSYAEVGAAFPKGA